MGVLRILLVEDEQHLANGIAFNLQAEGYQVEICDDGASALKKLSDEADAYALVILDLMLPGMSGYDICQWMRDSDNNTPVLILSARSLPEDRTRGFNVGADQYMTKPFELDELLSRVKNLIHRRNARQRAESHPPKLKLYEFANAKIDFETFEVQVADQTVRMTPLEMKLLEYFIRNEGRVIAREELLEEVWEMPGHIHTRAPDQFIRRLRKTFEPDPTNPRHFITIRDAGYRFVAT
ncbi:MAG: response regulator transcription factor [Pirellulaceae bacterium]|nr:response regulator transcription factor [Planctomycetales bacterium]